MSTLNTMNDYERQMDASGQEIASLYQLCGAVRELEEQTQNHREVYSKYSTFFYLTHQAYYSEIYHGIYRLLDETKGVASLIKLLKMKEEDKPTARDGLAKIEKDLLKAIQNNETAKKIKEFRNNKLGHKSKKLISDSILESLFYNDHKLNLEDIESLLHLLGEAIKKASYRADFHILPIPNTPIRLEIRNLFESLDEKANLNETL